eukprot:gene19384-26033_t
MRVSPHALSCLKPRVSPSFVSRCSIKRNTTFAHLACDDLRPMPSKRELGLLRAVVVDSQAATVSLVETGSVDRDSLNMQELLKLVSLLPESVRTPLENHPQLSQLVEVVLDLGRPPFARFPNDEVKLSDDNITEEALAEAIAQVGDFDTDNRAGINSTLHRISCIRNRQGKVVGLTCRAGRSIEGSGALVEDIGSGSLVEDLVQEGKSILFLGRPGVGKTTAIREISRMLADELHKRTVIVDTSNEIGGDGDVPHSGIGDARRMQVPRPEVQHLVMIEAVENHMPQVIVIDEIGTEEECMAARTIAQRGVQLVATAHGNALENVIKNPSLSDLIGGIQSVTLGDDTARKRGMQKSILERAHPPTFDVAVEMLGRGLWRVHMDVGAAVDGILMGVEPEGQVREQDPTTGAVRGITFTGTIRKVGEDGMARQMEKWVTGSGEVVLKPMRASSNSGEVLLSKALKPMCASSTSEEASPNQAGSRLMASSLPGAGKLPMPGLPRASSSLASMSTSLLQSLQQPVSKRSSAPSPTPSPTPTPNSASWTPSSSDVPATGSKDSPGERSEGSGSDSDTDLWPESTITATAAASSPQESHKRSKNQRMLWPESTCIAKAAASSTLESQKRSKNQRAIVNDATVAAAAECRPMRLFLFMDDDISDDQVNTEFFMDNDISDDQVNTEFFMDDDISDDKVNTEFFMDDDISDDQVNTEFFMDDDISDDQVLSILCSLGGPNAAQLVGSLDEAELKDTLRRSGVPLYAVRGSSAAGLARDLCPLLGLDPVKARSAMAEAAASALASEKKKGMTDKEAAECAVEAAAYVEEKAPKPKKGRVDNLSSADSHAQLMDSLVREVHGPVDRELAARLLNSFLAELNNTECGVPGGCQASSLATVAWALGKTKNKRKFMDSQIDSLERLADACSVRWKEFSAKDLLRLATGFGMLRFAPKQEGWVDSLLEYCSSADVLGSYLTETRDTMERFTDYLLTLEVLAGEED